MTKVATTQSEEQIAEVKRQAREAAFYVTPDGIWLRMDFTDEKTFTCRDEDTGDEYSIKYSTVLFTRKESFYRLAKIDKKPDPALISDVLRVISPELSEYLSAEVMRIGSNSKGKAYRLQYMAGSPDNEFPTVGLNQAALCRVIEELLTLFVDKPVKAMAYNGVLASWAGVQFVGTAEDFRIWQKQIQKELQSEWLTLTCPCGRFVSKQISELPFVTTPFICGKPNHWLIQVYDRPGVAK